MNVRRKRPGDLQALHVAHRMVEPAGSINSQINVIKEALGNFLTDLRRHTFFEIERTDGGRARAEGFKVPANYL